MPSGAVLLDDGVAAGEAANNIYGILDRWDKHWSNGKIKLKVFAFCSGVA